MTQNVESELKHDQRDDRALQLVASVLVLVVFAAALYAARDFTAVARWFPTGVALSGLVFTIAKVFVDVRTLRLPFVPVEVEHEWELEGGAGTRGIALWIGAVVVLLVLSRLVGFLYGATVWLPLVMLVVSKAKWYSAAIATLATYSLLWCAEVYLAMRWPPGVIDLSGIGF